MQHQMIPIVMFLCITYAITSTVKAIADARMRALLARNGVGEDLLRSILESEQQQQRTASLRWGLTMVALALGFGLLSISPTEDFGPGAIAVLAGAIGVGQLAFYFTAVRAGAVRFAARPPV